MATKLKLVFQSPRSRSALKAGIFAFLLALAAIGGYQILSVLLFSVVAIWLFFRPIFRTTGYVWPFFVFILAALIFMSVITGVYFWLGLIICSLVFYLLLGIKNLILVNREQALIFFVFGTLFLVLFSFFSSLPTGHFVIKIFAIFLATGILLRALLAQNALAWLIAILTAELSLVLAFLPIGFLQSTAMTLAVIFVAQDLLRKKIKNMIDRQGILSAIILLVLITLIVFFGSRWSF